MTDIAILFLCMFVLAVFCMSYFLFAYLDKKKQLDELTASIEMEEHEQSLLRVAHSQAYEIVKSAMKAHNDACHGQDEHFM